MAVCDPKGKTRNAESQIDPWQGAIFSFENDFAVDLQFVKPCINFDNLQFATPRFCLAKMYHVNSL